MPSFIPTRTPNMALVDCHKRKALEDAESDVREVKHVKPAFVYLGNEALVFKLVCNTAFEAYNQTSADSSKMHPFFSQFLVPVRATSKWLRDMIDDRFAIYTLCYSASNGLFTESLREDEGKNFPEACDACGYEEDDWEGECEMVISPMCYRIVERTRNDTLAFGADDADDDDDEEEEEEEEEVEGSQSDSPTDKAAVVIESLASKERVARSVSFSIARPFKNVFDWIHELGDTVDFVLCYCTLAHISQVMHCYKEAEPFIVAKRTEDMEVFEDIEWICPHRPPQKHRTDKDSDSKDADDDDEEDHQGADADSWSFALPTEEQCDHHHEEGTLWIEENRTEWKFLLYDTEARIQEICIKEKI